MLVFLRAKAIRGNTRFNPRTSRGNNPARFPVGSRGMRARRGIYDRFDRRGPARVLSYLLSRMRCASVDAVGKDAPKIYLLLYARFHRVDRTRGLYLCKYVHSKRGGPRYAIRAYDCFIRGNMHSRILPASLFSDKALRERYRREKKI